MKRYDKYKDSGVAWLGQVPSHWDVCKVKNYSKIFSGDSLPLKYETSFSEFPIYGGGSLIGYSLISNAKSSHLILGRVGGDGSVKIIGKDFWATDNALLIETTLNNYYLCHVLNCANLLRLNTSTAQPLLTASKIKDVAIPVPPLAEQEAIAAYLDEKCEAIDGMVEKIEEKIALFQRLRRAIITRAVTRGLNPDVPLRPSGIDWIGEVPEHWEITRIRNIIHKSKNGIKIGPFGSALTGNVQGNLPYKVYGQWNITGKDFKAGTGTIDEDCFKRLIKYEVVSGDILVSMMGTVGKCCAVPSNIQDGIMDSHVVKIRLNGEIYNPRFFEYIYDRDNSEFVISQIHINKKGSIMDGLNSTIIKNLYVSVPPLAEQQAIAEYLDRKCGKIDELVAKYEQQKELLARYKKALIAQVVTGQRRVCEPIFNYKASYLDNFPISMVAEI